MTKPRLAFLASVGLALGLVLSLGPASLRAAAPPPPSFVPPDAVPATPTATAASPDASAPGVASPDDSSGMGVPAPTISDDQQIANGLDMAMAMFHAEDYDGCVKATTAILEHWPHKQLYWVRYVRALSYEHQELYDQALDDYQKVRKEAPHTTYSNAADFRVGLCQLKSGDPDEAMYTLEDIIENNPHSEYRLQAYVHLGNLYRQTRDWVKAGRVYRDIMRYYPNTSWCWLATMYLAETDAHRGDEVGALRLYRGLVNDPRVPDSLRAQSELRMGDLYLEDQRWLEALEIYRLCLRDFSGIPGVQMTCAEKIQIATDGRRWHRVPYYQANVGVHAVSEGPADEEYLLQQEKLPGQ